uniref:Uncharacterized protein n=1 Tax=Arundo donax TaxID=35708 RepID=A0A0A9FGC7_ARUDO
MDGNGPARHLKILPRVIGSSLCRYLRIKKALFSSSRSRAMRAMWWRLWGSRRREQSLFYS